MRKIIPTSVFGVTSIVMFIFYPSVDAQETNRISFIVNSDQIVSNYSSQMEIEENPNAFAVYFDDTYAGHIEDIIEIDPSMVGEISIITREDGENWFSNENMDDATGLKILNASTDDLMQDCTDSSKPCQLSFAPEDLITDESNTIALYYGGPSIGSRMQTVHFRTNPSGAEVIINSGDPYWEVTECTINIPVVEDVPTNIVLRYNGKSSGIITLTADQTEVNYTFIQ